MLDEVNCLAATKILGEIRSFDTAHDRKIIEGIRAISKLFILGKRRRVVEHDCENEHYGAESKNWLQSV